MDRSVFFNLTNFAHSLLRQKGGTLRRSERILSKASLHTFPSRTNMTPATTTINDTLSTNEITFQGFIAHESLGRFLFLASKVKSLRLSFIAKTVPNPSEVSILLDSKHNQMQKYEQDEMASFVRLKLLGKSFEQLSLNNVNHSGGGSVTNERQLFLDSLMYDSIEVLVKDLDKCMKWYVRFSTSQSLVNSSARVTRIPVKGKNPKKGTSDAIAIKYSKEQTDILTNWMIENKSHPFPKAEEINALAKATNLTYSQVVNWTTNVRKRNLKATVEKGKKPHHFLDFLFLADYRDKQGFIDGNHRVVHGGNRRKSANTRSSVKGKDLDTLKASKNNHASSKTKDRIKRTKLEVDSENNEFPLLVSTNNTPALVKFDGINVSSNNEGIQSSFTTPMREQSLYGDKYVFGSYPNLNSVLSFVPLPRQVTPPRSSSVDSIHAAEKDCFYDQLNNLPPVDEMLNWPEHDIMSNRMNIVEDEPMSEDALVKIFTQNGLVSTPKRRDSFEMFKDLDDDKFTVQLEHVFREKEEDLMSISEDDLDVIMENDDPLDDPFLSLVGLDDLDF